MMHTVPIYTIKLISYLSFFLPFSLSSFLPPHLPLFLPPSFLPSMASDQSLRACSTML